MKQTPSTGSSKVDKTKYDSPLARVISAPWFDHCMGVVIIANMVIIIVETDHAAKHDDSLASVNACGWAILIIFIIELAMRLIVFQTSFFLDHWNTFDFLIVSIDCIFSIIGLILGSVFPVSTLRVFRLCKLARVSKVFRVFPELRIMMAGLLGSMRAIFWGTVLLAFVLLVWAIVAVQFIHPLMTELDESGQLEGCERCPRAYSSVMQSTLTFSQQIVAGDSWGTATVPVIEAYPVAAIFFMGVFLSVGFAVMNLILGVVVNVAQSEHDRLKGEIDDAKNIQRMEAAGNLRGICQQMDADGSGELSKDELLGGYREREDFREAIEELELTEEDLGVAFAGMDADKSGSVSYDEFLKKIYKMKESDTQFCMEQLKYNIMQVRDTIMNKLLQQQTALLALEHAEMSSLDKLMEDAEGLSSAAAEEASARDSAGQKKEQKFSLPEAPDAVPISPKTPKAGSARQAKEKDSMGSLEIIEIRTAIDTVSQHLQGELRNDLKRLTDNLDQHALHTSAMLLQIQAAKRPEDAEDVQQVRKNMNMSFMQAPVCCKV